MDMYYVEKRRRSLSDTILQESYTDMDALRERCITSPDHNNILKFIENYNQFRYTHNSFNNMLDIVSEYYLNNNDKNFKDILLAVSRIIPLEKDLRVAKESLIIFSDKTSLDVDKILGEIDKYITADRILNNREKINKRFDIDKFVNEYKLYTEEDTFNLIEELCFKIDTFNAPKEIKYNLALENITYELYKKGISVEKEDLLYKITEYFSIQDVDVESVLEINTIFNKNKHNVLSKLKSKSVSKVRDFISKLKSTEIKTPEQVRPVLRLMYSQSPQQVMDDLPNFFTWFRTFIAFTTFTIHPYIGILVMLVDQFIASNVKKTEAERMINEFKHEKQICENKVNKLKNQKAKDNLSKYIDQLDQSIRKLEDYRDSLYSERGIDEMKQEMSIEKKRMLDSLNEGVANYRPYFINVNKFFDRYHNEVFRENNNIMKEFKKYQKCTGIMESLELYPTCNEIGPNNINHYMLESGELYIKLAHVDASDKVNMMMNNISCHLSEGYCLSTEDNDAGVDIYLMSNYAIDLNEQVIHKELLKKAALIHDIEESVNYIFENSNDVLSESRKYISLLDGESLRDLSYITSMNEFADNSILKDIILEEMDNTQDKNKREDQKKSVDNLDYRWLPVNKRENIYRLHTLKNSVKEVKESFEMLSENALTNNLLLVKEKMRKAAVSLSDKDKMYSQRIDNMVDNMINKTQKNLTNKNREAVIKGSILPSASSVIKLAVASGTAALVNPALAVISLIGGLALSKIGTEKERQYILDEIEIELKLVDRKIQLAERNDDTKSLEQLYRIQKQLKREETRIKYNKKDFRPIERER